MSHIFGYQILPKNSAMNEIMFEGTRPVLVRSKSGSQFGQLRLFANLNSDLQTWNSSEGGVCSYVWGIPAHPDIATSDIPKWCAKIVSEKRYGRFREIIGPFVVIIDEAVNHRITLITDVLGVRPMFFGVHNGRLILGSDVWQMQKAGLSNGVIDYDAVASWIAYGYNCTDGSLFSDFQRLPPGSAVVFEDNQLLTEIPYARFESQTQTATTEEAAEDLHQIVLSNMKTLLAGHNRISIALSGGYDSRYLLSLLLSLRKDFKESIECATVSFTDQEGHVASQVADALGLPLKTIPVNGSIWDIYDQVYHFTPDGFPISKFVTYCIAQQYPEIRMVNGFMGDSIMRGSKDTFMGKYETEWNEDLAGVLQRKHLLISFNIFRKDIAERIRTRSRIPMEEAVRKGSHIGKIFTWTDFYYRQRHYISNNFLQHIGISEVLLPFYSWVLLSYKIEHDYRIFNRDIYQYIFRNHCPKLAKIPHASDITSMKKHFPRVARCTKRWARQLLPVMCSRKWLSILSKRQCIPLNIAEIVGLKRYEHAIFVFERLYLLEKRTREAGVNFDWGGI